MDDTLTFPEINPAALLRLYQLSPKKGLGQNFLVDASALRRIVSAAEIPTNAVVLEIGPGLGSLTRHLGRAAGKVVAVELDAHLIPVLRDVLKDSPNVFVYQGDILKISPDDLELSDGYLVVANIPYYITSAVIRHLLEAPIKPSRVVLTIQREVADRICAEPGEMSLLALSVQVYGEPKLVGRIPAGAFYPAPKVDSAVVRIDLYQEPLIPPAYLEVFFRLIKAGFSQKRKTLRNSLSAGLGWPAARALKLLEMAQVDPQRRAETLTLAEWRLLSESYRLLSE